jgi:ribosomal protein S18 acetylase RimI-like enzyme
VCGDGEVRVETYDGPAAILTEELQALYGAVYAEPPYRDDPADVAEFVAEWPELVARPGFRLVLARASGAGPVGFALGYPVGRDSDWWPAVTGPASPVDAGGDDRGFGIAELGVHPAWRRRRIAGRLHEALLAGRAERRVVLWVRPDAAAAWATYHRWGYRVVGAARTDPYQVMCLHLTPPTPGGTR